MGVKQEGSGENKRCAAAGRFHFEEGGKKPNHQQHIERAVATLPRVQEKLDRHGKQGGGRERRQAISSQAPKKKINGGNRQPTCQRERKSRGESVLPKNQKGAGCQIILDPRVGHHNQASIQTRTMVRIKKRVAIPGFWNTKFQYIDRQRGGVAFIFPEVVGSEVSEYQYSTETRDSGRRPMQTQPAELAQSGKK